MFHKRSEIVSVFRQISPLRNRPTGTAVTALVAAVSVDTCTAKKKKTVGNLLISVNLGEKQDNIFVFFF